MPSVFKSPEYDTLSEKYQQLIDLRMRGLSSYSRLWRMRMAGHFQSLWAIAYPQVFDLHVEVHEPNVDVKLTFGEKVVWSRWKTTTPVIEIFYNGEWLKANQHDFRDKIASLIIQ
jgi:hypothetical protein